MTNSNLHQLLHFCSPLSGLPVTDGDSWLASDFIHKYLVAKTTQWSKNPHYPSIIMHIHHFITTANILSVSSRSIVSYTRIWSFDLLASTGTSNPTPCRNHSKSLCPCPIRAKQVIWWTACRPFYHSSKLPTKVRKPSVFLFPSCGLHVSPMVISRSQW